MAWISMTSTISCVIIAFCAYYWQENLQSFLSYSTGNDFVVVQKPQSDKKRLLDSEDLKQYNGEDGSKGLYLAILGKVFDVSKGKEHYGPGGGYSFFAGRDGSRAFVTGDFSEAGLTDDVSGLKSSDYMGLDEWVKFYRKDYKYVGKLIGRFYDNDGKPTEYFHMVKKKIAEAYSEKERESAEKRIFPPCNTEWSPEHGSKVWCTNRSGGIERSWTGVPRQLFIPGTSNVRCACVKNFGPPSHDPSRVEHNNIGDLDNPNLKEYSGCDSHSFECAYK